MAELGAKAREAARTGDREQASAVHNLAALLASDCGMPDLARQWCHRHANLYLHARPLHAQAVRQALEPLVNLARLRIRAGDGLGACALVDTLHTAVATRTDTTIDGIHIPAARMATTRDEHREIRRWLWVVLLATTARGLAGAGRWEQAHARLLQHKGVGRRMLDGRQVAVLAHASTGDTRGALELCATTLPGDPWEQAVTACLATLCHPHGDNAALLPGLLRTLAPDKPGLTVFGCRLGLSAVDALTAHDFPRARTLGLDLIHHTIANPDGYTARDLLKHPLCSELLTPSQAHRLANLVHTCALGTGVLPAALRAELDTALTMTEPIMANAAPRTSNEQSDRVRQAPADSAARPA
ncbi:hypothetical protein [Embleya scabrispora]|uniref:hypothetical protein n=1 Tax=Embleya scabrispora TaxID=159449 RepID=UPI001912B208|nr:hypothetical protein [Embleya scabrispora]